MTKLAASLHRTGNRRVLVVDDEADVLDFLRIYLESLGWDVTTVVSAEAGLEALERQAYFVIITDIAMPKMDGYEFITRLREMAIPSGLVVMTGFGYNPKHTLLKIRKTVHYPCLFKPLNRRKIAEIVQSAWEAYHKRPPLPEQL